MSMILGQISVGVGGILFVVIFFVGLSRGTPLFDAAVKASIVWCASSVALAMFFKAFTKILYSFVAERAMEHSKQKDKERESARNAANNAGLEEPASASEV